MKNKKIKKILKLTSKVNFRPSNANLNKLANNDLTIEDVFIEFKEFIKNKYGIDIAVVKIDNIYTVTVPELHISNDFYSKSFNRAVEHFVNINKGYIFAIKKMIENILNPIIKIKLDKRTDSFKRVFKKNIRCKYSLTRYEVIKKNIKLKDLYIFNEDLYLQVELKRIKPLVNDELDNTEKKINLDSRNPNVLSYLIKNKVYKNE